MQLPQQGKRQKWTFTEGLPTLNPWPGATHSANRISTPVLQIRTKPCSFQLQSQNCHSVFPATSEILDDGTKAADRTLVVATTTGPKYFEIIKSLFKNLQTSHITTGKQEGDPRWPETTAHTVEKAWGVLWGCLGCIREAGPFPGHRQETHGGAKDSHPVCAREDVWRLRWWEACDIPHPGDTLLVCFLAYCSLPAPSLRAAMTSAAFPGSYGESQHKDQLPTTYPETFEEDEHRKGEAPNFTN